MPEVVEACPTPSSGTGATVALWRFLFLISLFTAEVLIATLFLDGASLAAKPGLLTAFIANWGAWVARWATGAMGVFLAMTWMRYRDALPGIGAAWGSAPIARGFAWLHVAGVLAFGWLSLHFYGLGGAAKWIPALWVFALAVTVLSAIFAIAPPRNWLLLFRSTGMNWLLAPVVAAAGCWLGMVSRQLWAPAARLTFDIVGVLLAPFVSNLTLLPKDLSIATSRFDVQISEQCSGLEGVGLMLVFGACWLVLFRQEIRLRRAVLVLPVAMAGLFLLNATRIAALFLIGEWGHPDIAVGGFHSQAGWLIFNAVALGLCVGARKVAWLRKPEAEAIDISHVNPAVPYLLPFLLLVAGGMVSHAFSAGFEWMYPLRTAAALAALWTLRNSYREIDWRIGWSAPALGVLVFAIWIAGTSGVSPMPVELAASAPPARWAWLVLRVLSAVVVVPVAEELAFRGFLLRRLVSENFETVSYRSFTWLSVSVSSVLFGLIHDGHWMVGMLAGALFALAARRSGRLGDAIVSHAVANALLAVYVLQFEQWRLW